MAEVYGAWSTLGSIATAIFTLGLMVAAIFAGIQAGKTFTALKEDQASSAERFAAEMRQRDQHAYQAVWNAATLRLISATSDVAAAAEQSVMAVNQRAIELRKAQLEFILVNELQKGQGAVEQMCTTLIVLAKASQMSGYRIAGAREELDRGFGQLFQGILALHRGDIDMPNFLEALSEFVETVRLRRPLIVPGSALRAERVVDF